jgi:hypothetical protein
MADTPKSVYVVAREIAVRLERAGENPYSDQRSQYLILGDGRGAGAGSSRKRILNLATNYL